MDIKNKNEVLSKAYSDSQGMIALADSKANISLTIHSLLITIGLGFSLLSDVFKKAGILFDEYQGFIIFYVIITIVLIISSISGTICTIFVFKPREAKEKSERERKGLFYFKHVLKYKNSNDYYSKIKDLNEEDLMEEYSKQIYQLSYIAKEKFKFVNYSIYFLITNMGLTILFLILSGFINLLV